MRFLCQVWVDETVFDKLTKEEKNRLDRESLAHDRTLAADGSLVLASPLGPPRTARTVRVRNGRASITDGPFTETREVLGGFAVVDVADDAAAKEWGARIAEACGWPHEIRRVF